MDTWTAVNLSNRTAAAMREMEIVPAAAGVTVAVAFVVAMSVEESFPAAETHRLSCSIEVKLKEPAERILRIAAYSSDQQPRSSFEGTACRPKRETQPPRAPPVTVGEVTEARSAGG